MGNSLLLVGAKLGMDVRICAPKALWPHDDLVGRCKKYAEESGARITLTEDPKAAVKGVDFEVHEGELVSLIGSNGAGKTTTMRLVCGALTADSGEITVGGFDINQQTEQPLNEANAEIAEL